MSQTALERLDLLETVARYVATPMSQNAACKLLGASPASVTRWGRAYRAVLEATGDRQAALAALEPDLKGRVGRKPLVTLSDDERIHVQRLHVQMESVTAALRTFADSPACSHEVAEVIRQPRRSKHTLTPTLRRQARVAEQVINFARSPKKVRVNAWLCPRTLEYVDALGTRKTLQPGDLRERDDMSNNFVVWVPWPWGGDPCSDKYGVRVARGQCLEELDVRSRFFTSFNFLIRLRDSYRADDIWQWIAQSYTHVGLPRIGERWERGTWASRKLRGDQDALIEAGHTSDSARLSGLAALGVRIITSQSPTTKTIEGCFNVLQRFESTIPGQIGRKRGEYEATTRRWMQCRAGQADPREWFLSYEQACDALEKAHLQYNWEPVEGLNSRGIPAQLWEQAMQEAPLAKLTPERGYLFARAKTEITVRKGQVMVRRTHDGGTPYGLYFSHADLWRAEGQKVAVYYDSDCPAGGATFVVLEGHGLKAGTVLAGECIDPGPQFALDTPGSTIADPAGLARKKGFMDAVISEVRTLGLHGRTSRTSSADNGLGSRTQLSHAGSGGHGAPREAATANRDSAHETPAPRRAEISLTRDEKRARYEASLERLSADREAGEFLPV